MALKVIGAGLGRTGTFSLKIALERLGLGPCHHMEEVLKAGPVQVPLWSAAIAGTPDWEATFRGFNAAVDWPTAAFWRELADYYPEAKVILTTRTPESWYESYSATIAKLMSMRDESPPHMRDWFAMALAVTVKSGVGNRKDRAEVIEAFRTNETRVREALPADRLLVYQVREGWEPLCAFLGKPVPAEPFPNTNDQEQFWELVKRGMESGG